MCPIWPLHIVLFYLLTLVPVWVICQKAPSLLLASFDPSMLTVHMDSTEMFNLTLPPQEDFQEGDIVQLYSERSHIADVKLKTFILEEKGLRDGWQKFVNVSGNFLGKTAIKVKVLTKNGAQDVHAESSLDVTVIRKERVIDTVFTASVATLVSLIYINFGCALDWPTVKATVKRPIGPAIGFVGQFVFMPLISFGLGQLLFPNDEAMQLGMFFTGVSPGGGASNIWTYVLGGNLNLSITMTTISTLAAFAMMPMWLFSLGRVIFTNANLTVPYRNIATFAVGLVIPLGIGLICQKKLPRFAALMVRILKAFSSLLLLFIIVFAIVTNLYLFELFSWQILVAGMFVPWLGYIAGWLAAWVFKQSSDDCLAIALETGIQNTGIAIFLLRFSLAQPMADLTTVVPVAVAIMTPIPLLFMWMCQAARNWVAARKQNKKRYDAETDIIPYSSTQETIIAADEKY